MLLTLDFHTLMMLVVISSSLQLNKGENAHRNVTHSYVEPVYTRDISYAYIETGLRPREISEEEFETAVSNAFETWSRVIPISFKRLQAADDYKDVVIKWHTNTTDKNDFSFLPGNGILAHAQPPTGLYGGYIHFSPWNAWYTNCTHGNPNGYDIQSEALHEIGHLLGFKHINNTLSVMYPYAIYICRRQLGRIDIQQVQDAYGVRNLTTSSYIPEELILRASLVSLANPQGTAYGKLDVGSLRIALILFSFVLYLLVTH